MRTDPRTRMPVRPAPDLPPPTDQLERCECEMIAELICTSEGCCGPLDCAGWPQRTPLR